MNNTSLKISKKLLIYIVTALTLIFFSGISVRAAEAQHQISFDTLQKITIENEPSEKIWNKIALKPIDKKTVENPPIISYAVNNDGKIAIAFDGAIICVYDDSFKMINAFTLDKTGAYGVDWHNNDLLYIDVRGAFAVQFSIDGNPVNIYSITEREEFYEYYKKVVLSSDHTMNDTAYSINTAYDSDKLMTRHGLQQLVKTDSEGGNAEILYQHTYKSWEEEMNDNALPAAFLLLLAVNTLILIAVRIKRLLSGEYFKEKPAYETPQYTKK